MVRRLHGGTNEQLGGTHLVHALLYWVAGKWYSRYLSRLCFSQYDFKWSFESVFGDIAYCLRYRQTLVLSRITMTNFFKKRKIPFRRVEIVLHYKQQHLRKKF